MGVPTYLWYERRGLGERPLRPALDVLAVLQPRLDQLALEVDRILQPSRGTRPPHTRGKRRRALSLPRMRRGFGEVPSVPERRWIAIISTASRRRRRRRGGGVRSRRASHTRVGQLARRKRDPSFARGSPSCARAPRRTFGRSASVSSHSLRTSFEQPCLSARASAPATTAAGHGWSSGTRLSSNRSQYYTQAATDTTRHDTARHGMARDGTARYETMTARMFDRRGGRHGIITICQRVTEAASVKKSRGRCTPARHRD